MTDTKTRDSLRGEAQGEEGYSAEEQKGSARSGTPRKALRYLTLPVFLVLVCSALYLWVSGLTLDDIEQRVLNQNYIFTKVIEHLELAGTVTIVVVVTAITAGVILTRPVMQRVAPTIVGIASIGQAIPSIGLLVLFAIWFGVGFRWAVLALIVYSFLPVLRNTMVGLQQVDRSVIEAGRGMGMTKMAVLFRIEIPLAIPIMLAGIRTALILAVGTAALATYTNAGGMGDIIDVGLSLSRDSVLITGAVLTAVLALLIDYVAGVAEDILKPKGLR